MPRKGNPQHNARKRSARLLAKAEYEAGGWHREAAAVAHIRRVAAENRDTFELLAATLLAADAARSKTP